MFDAVLPVCVHEGAMTQFVIAGFLEPTDGYGYGAIKIGQALRRHLGDQVKLADLRQQRTFDLPVVAVCTPDWLTEIEAPVLVAHTMFEATRLPLGLNGTPWVDLLNARAEAVVVPCEWCAEVFVENGVRRPVKVLSPAPAGSDFVHVKVGAARHGGDARPMALVFTPDPGTPVVLQFQPGTFGSTVTDLLSGNTLQVESDDSRQRVTVPPTPWGIAVLAG